MGIKLKWDSQADLSLDAVEVYRSRTKIDYNNLPAVLATLPGSATTYEDITVKNATAYYYVIATVKNNIRVFSLNIQMGYYPATGPGTQQLQRGDWDAGYFCELTPSDLVTAATLATMLPQLANNNVTVMSEPQIWAKCVYKGKILFIPNRPMFRGTYANLYKSGTLFGTDDPGTPPSGATATPQRTTVQLGNNLFVLRPLRFSERPFTELITTPDQYADSEWKRCLCPMLQQTDTALAAASVTYPRMNDWTSSLVAAGGAHLTSATTLLSFNASNPELDVGTIALTSVSAFHYILEYVQP